MINDLIETREGIYWIATNKGPVRFDPCGTPAAAVRQPMFSTFLRIWTRGGYLSIVYRLTRPDGCI